MGLMDQTQENLLPGPDGDLRIRPAADGDKSAWDQYVLAHPDGMAYHRYAWGEAVREAYGHKPYYLFAEQDGRIRGVLPLIDFRVPLSGRTLTSLPFCDVGGALADHPPIETLLRTAAIHFAGRLGARGVMERRCRLRSAAPDAGGSAQNGKVVMKIHLPESAAALMQSLKSKLRSQANKPQREGLRACLGGAELIDDFYGIFTRNMRDLGSPVHSRKWIQAVVKAYGEAARVGVVYLADGRPAAAGIILLHGATISLPWASSLRQYNHLNPNMLLYRTFLAYGADHGFSIFDLGRSTPGEGTFRFKEQWGATPVPLTWVYHGGDGTEADGITRPGLLRQWAESAWRHCPMIFCNIAGPAIRRYVSL